MIYIKIFFVFEILKEVLWFFILIKKFILGFWCIFILDSIAYLAFNLTDFLNITNLIYLTNILDFLILRLRILFKRIILYLNNTLFIWFQALQQIFGTYIIFITFLGNLNFLFLRYRMINWLLLASSGHLQINMNSWILFYIYIVAV